MAQIVFVGGVTGSGKTTICERVQRDFGDAVSVFHIGALACQLAEQYGLATRSIEEASARHLLECQRLVVERLIPQLVVILPNKWVLLDGHFVLPGIERPSFRLPSWFFQQLGVTGILLCH